MLTREQIAARAAREFEVGSRIQLGAGLPALCTTATAEGVTLQHAKQDGDGAAGGDEADILVLEGAQLSKQGELSLDSQEGTLLAKAAKILVLMSHCTETDEPRIVEQCTLPVAAKEGVYRIITELAVIDMCPEGLVLRELVDGCSARDIQAKTGVALLAAADLKLLRVG